MDQLICASLSHTHYWYEVGTWEVPAMTDQSGMVANRARGQLDRENEYFAVPVRA